MSKYAYFSGCAQHSVAKEYNDSTQEVCNRLGVQLIEIPDWNCCGAASARSLSGNLDLALNARNLHLASEMQMDLVAPCASCFHRLAETHRTLSNNQEICAQISEVTGERLNLTSKVKPLLEILTTNDTLNKLQRESQKSLSGLKVVAYYGCLLTRPPKIGFDQAEYPVSMDKLVIRMGGESLPWPYKTECCGANLSLTQQDVSLKLVQRLLDMAKECGADCIITACPLCQVNLDLSQRQIFKENGYNYNLPVLYFTQLMGLVLGMSYKSMGLHRHFINPKDILQRVGMV